MKNHIISVSDNHLEKETNDATTDSVGSSSDSEAHGIFSKDRRRGSYWKVDDGKSNLVIVKDMKKLYLHKTA